VALAETGFGAVGQTGAILGFVWGREGRLEGLDYVKYMTSEGSAGEASRLGAKQVCATDESMIYYK